jgi:hypothetical protein
MEAAIGIELMKKLLQLVKVFVQESAKEHICIFV